MYNHQKMEKKTICKDAQLIQDDREDSKYQGGKNTPTQEIERATQDSKGTRFEGRRNWSQQNANKFRQRTKIP